MRAFLDEEDHRAKVANAGSLMFGNENRPHLSDW